MDGIELMATALHAARERLETATQNLANVSSGGGFSRRLARATLGEHGLSITHGVDRSSGPLERTGRALDVATTGPGGFFVRDGGKTTLVRSASLTAVAGGGFEDERGRSVLLVDSAGALRDGPLEGKLRAAPGTTLRSGFLERPNVDAIGEMVEVLEAQRAFETAEKTIAAIDDARAKDANDVARVKS